MQSCLQFTVQSKVQSRFQFNVQFKLQSRVQPRLQPKVKPRMHWYSQGYSLVRVFCEVKVAVIGAAKGIIIGTVKDEVYRKKCNLGSSLGQTSVKPIVQ